MTGEPPIASSGAVPARLAELFGTLDDVRSLGGGVWRIRVAGRDLVVKTGTGVTDEAEGLSALAAVGGAPPVPAVVRVELDLLVSTFVEEGRRTAAHEEALGRGLAVLHGAVWPTWGGGSGWIGSCPVGPGEHPDAATFYADRLLELGQRCGLGPDVAAVVDRLAELLPSGGPALVHGDLWWGNVLWGADGRAWLIDPSAHGGHPEEDLAMLGLFGPVPDRLLRAYLEVHPLEPGWPDRVDLFRLIPLLVHTVLFGGGYRQQAEAALHRFR